MGRCLPHLFQGQPHGGQQGEGVAQRRDVVEASDHHVAGHRHPDAPQGRHDPERHDVIDGEQADVLLSRLSTLGQALDLAAPFPAETVGVVVDTFHVWWDPQLSEQIRRASAEGRLASYQVCDWNLPIASDALLPRGYMGDGYIDFATVGQWVADAGYAGPVEVEIFNQKIWDAPAAEVVEIVKARYAEHVLPYL